MRQIVLVIILLINCQIELHAREPTKSSCGRRLAPRVVNLIIGGKKSNEGDWPWHAAIYRTTNRITKYTCGGSVINSNSVLTAAHCVSEDDRSVIADRLSVHLGRHDLRSLGNTKEFHVFKVIPHPSYNHLNRSNDIAIIRLSTEITFNKFIQPVCLWDSSKLSITEVTDKLGTLVGWGVTETDQVSDILRQAEIPVVSFGTCLSNNRDVFGQFLSDDTFCAGFLNGTGACNGDSGGSLTFEENGVHRIRGIVSLSANRKDNRDLCDSKGYALFTDVARYLTWIEGETPHLPHYRTNQNTEGCEKKVKCDFIHSMDGDGKFLCRPEFYLEPHKEHCKIIFEEDSNTNVIALSIFGRMDVIPDVSSAFEKFENIEALDLALLQIKNVERSKLTAARRISLLSFDGNRIADLAADTFDDLKLLKALNLNGNSLKSVHRDLFKELRNLGSIWLDRNELEVLPEGIFRNNQKLKEIFVSKNNIKTILIDFINLPNLIEIDLSDNKCIDADCFVSDFCNTGSKREMQIKIWKKC